MDTFTSNFHPLKINGKLVFTKDQLNQYSSEYENDNCWSLIMAPNKNIYNKILPGFLDNPHTNAEYEVEYYYFLTMFPPDDRYAVAFSTDQMKELFQKDQEDEKKKALKKNFKNNNKRR
jgi:hypothetical protein